LEELVFAIPTDQLWKLLTYKERGLVDESCAGLEKVIQYGQFRKRGELEEDPSFKQFIPYAVISNQESFLLFERRSGQTEKRLHHKYSLGVGGHMNPGNVQESADQFVINELKREFSEEVRLLNGCFIEEIEFIGFLNDDTIPVGRVHIGLFFNIQVSSKDMVIKETDKMRADWIDKAGLSEFYDSMETWSQFIVDQYIK